MTSLVTYTRSGPISRIVMDDGKVNVMSINMLEALPSRTTLLAMLPTL